MAVVEGLLKFTLGAIHASLWLRDAICYSFLWLWTGLLYAVKDKGSKLECIQEDTKELKKIPQHLALIVHEERLSHADLAKIVTWAFAAGTHHVSIYSSQGTKIIISPRVIPYTSLDLIAISTNHANINLLYTIIINLVCKRT